MSMKFTLQPHHRRALILLLSALGLYFLLSRVLFPVYDTLAAAEAAALEKENQLLRYRRAVAREGDYTALLEEAYARIAEGEALLIPGDNPSLASAELQAIVEEAASSTGIELGQRNLSSAQRVDEYFNEITMSLVFQCTPGQLVRMLSTVRSADRLVTVRAIQVSPLEATDGDPEGAFVKDLYVTVTFAAIVGIPDGEAG